MITAGGIYGTIRGDLGHRPPRRGGARRRAHAGPEAVSGAPGPPCPGRPTRPRRSSRDARSRERARRGRLMRRNFWYLTITLVLIVGAFVATLLSDNRPMLGLDLQGGISVVLAPVGDGEERGVAQQGRRHHPQPGRLPRGRRAGDQPAGLQRDHRPPGRAGPRQGAPARRQDRRAALPPGARAPPADTESKTTTTTKAEDVDDHRGRRRRDHVEQHRDDHHHERRRSRPRPRPRTRPTRP